jgi:hypothetical protein
MYEILRIHIFAFAFLFHRVSKLCILAAGVNVVSLLKDRFLA